MSLPVPTSPAPKSVMAEPADASRPMVDPSSTTHADLPSRGRVDVHDILRSALRGLINEGTHDVSILARLSYLEQLDANAPDFLSELRECNALLDETKIDEVYETRTITVGQPGAQCWFFVRIDSAMGEPVEFSILRVDPSFNEYPTEIRSALNAELYERVTSIFEMRQEPAGPSEALETSETTQERRR